MYTIDLNEQVMGMDGKPIQDASKGRPINMKDLIIDYLAFNQSQNGEHLIASSVLAHKVYKMVGKAELYDVEMDVLRKAIQNPRHVALVYGWLANRIRSAKPNDAAEPK